MAFGIFLIWYVFKDLTDAEMDELKSAFSKANYFWVGLAIICGFLSHVSRAVRWSYMLNSLGYKPSVVNNYHAVMIAYVVNMILPRAGEASRCALMTKYEGIPFNKSFGTVVAERAIDLTVLLSVTAITILTQFSILSDSEEAQEMLSGASGKFSQGTIYWVLGGIVIGILLLILIMRRYSHVAFIIKMKAFFKGIGDGLKTIFTMEKKIQYLVHTVFIWGMYLAALICCLLALDVTENFSIGAVLAAFVFGSFAIALVQGGIGAYPFAVMKALMLYGVAKTTGLAAGWIVWSSQTLLLIVLGGLSMILVISYNKNREVPKETPAG